VTVFTLLTPRIRSEYTALKEFICCVSLLSNSCFLFFKFHWTELNTCLLGSTKFHSHYSYFKNHFLHKDENTGYKMCSNTRTSCTDYNLPAPICWREFRETIKKICLLPVRESNTQPQEYVG
jgi:hypothetical protein